MLKGGGEYSDTLQFTELLMVNFTRFCLKKVIISQITKSKGIKIQCRGEWVKKGTAERRLQLSIERGRLRFAPKLFDV